MPWLLTLPSGETFTCDAFDAPRDGSIHMLNGVHEPSRTSADHWVIHYPPASFTVERVEP